MKRKLLLILNYFKVDIVLRAPLYIHTNVASLHFGIW